MDPFIIKKLALTLILLLFPIGALLMIKYSSKFNFLMMTKLFTIIMIVFFCVYFNFKYADEPAILKEIVNVKYINLDEIELKENPKQQPSKPLPQTLGITTDTLQGNLNYLFELHDQKRLNKRNLHIEEVKIIRTDDSNRDIFWMDPNLFISVWGLTSENSNFITHMCISNHELGEPNKAFFTCFLVIKILNYKMPYEEITKLFYHDLLNLNENNEYNFSNLDNTVIRDNIKYRLIASGQKNEFWFIIQPAQEEEKPINDYIKKKFTI